MNVTQLKNIIIPEIASFCDVPVIEADQIGERPSGPHATFKVTSPYLKDVGQAEQIMHQNGENLQLKHVESYKIVVSFTAYAMDSDTSFDLAQKIHDWFAFYGSDVLDSNDIVVVEQTAIQNRDVFLIDDYERRNGFDVTLRVTKEMVKNIDWFDKVESITV
jgi:hypothetical protein